MHGGGAAEAQQPTRIPRIGYLVLSPLSEAPSPERAAFLDGLRELGWVEGKTVAIEYRSAKWNPELFTEERTGREGPFPCAVRR